MGKALVNGLWWRGDFVNFFCLDTKETKNQGSMKFLKNLYCLQANAMIIPGERPGSIAFTHRTAENFAVKKLYA